VGAPSVAWCGAMPKPHDLDDLRDAMTAWRRGLHAHPELGFAEHRTAALVSRELRAAGIEVAEGIAGTGVVGTIRGARPGDRAVGLRADMDALAMPEATGLPWASTDPGRMHACGHDGHTAMLLGAARWLAANRVAFGGVVRLIFQPAEESLGGAARMVAEGLFERFPMEAVYGLHNLPGLPLGVVAVPAGAVLASSDTWEVRFTGAGTHGAKPHLGTDSVLAAAAFIQALQMLAAREVDPLDAAVVSVGHVAAGDSAAPNVIPGEVFLRGTARAFSEPVRGHLEARIGAIAAAVALAHRVLAAPRYIRRLSPTVNDAGRAAVALAAARATVGEAARGEHPPITAGEDFSEMLAARPGAYAWLGTGAPRHPEGVHHNPHFDFNDDALTTGAAWWCSVALQELSA